MPTGIFASLGGNWNTRWSRVGGSQRTCPDCGALQDWVVNAARHLLAYGLTVLGALQRVPPDTKPGEKKALAIVTRRR
ncbi:hypothetical protein A7K73_06610 [Candidatus Methylacidiphilum fumarolicum]|nr:hypothetical protein A7K73_06610 [Candidatus Methylacidiphilum fumarolicum]